MLRDIKDRLAVHYGQRLVGTLALTETGLVAFSYDEKWLADGFSISPLSLPLRSGVFVPKKNNFGGLFGVFADSLPDSWGSFVSDQYLQSQGLDPSSVSVLTKLALLGSDGLGALWYGVKEKESVVSSIDYEKAREDCELLLKKRNGAPLDELMRLGGSSGGAHPKIHLERADGTSWIVKFPGPTDTFAISKMEYDYNEAAVACGLEVSPFELAKGSRHSYFASQRFDRQNGTRQHVLTLAGLYEAGLSEGLLDYTQLIAAALTLSHDEEQGWKAFRLMCFNVYARNEDDHAKNFSFIYDEAKRHYVLAPAYDLTYPGLEKGHSLTVNRQYYPTDKDLLAVADCFSLDPQKCLAIMTKTKEIVEKRLRKYWR